MASLSWRGRLIASLLLASGGDAHKCAPPPWAIKIRRHRRAQALSRRLPQNGSDLDGAEPRHTYKFMMVVLSSGSGGGLLAGDNAHATAISARRSRTVPRISFPSIASSPGFFAIIDGPAGLVPLSLIFG
jgi:hypothetical protein